MPSHAERVTAKRAKHADRMAAVVERTVNPFTATQSPQPPPSTVLTASGRSTLLRLSHSDGPPDVSAEIGINRQYFADAYYVPPGPLRLDRTLTAMTLAVERAGGGAAPREWSALSPYQRSLLAHADLDNLSAAANTALDVQ